MPGKGRLDRRQPQAQGSSRQAGHDWVAAHAHENRICTCRPTPRITIPTSFSTTTSSRSCAGSHSQLQGRVDREHPFRAAAALRKVGLSLHASSRSISRPSHPPRAQSQTARVRHLLQSQPIAPESGLDCASGRSSLRVAIPTVPGDGSSRFERPWPSPWPRSDLVRGLHRSWSGRPSDSVAA